MSGSLDGDALLKGELAAWQRRVEERLGDLENRMQALVVATEPADVPQPRAVFYMRWDERDRERRFAIGGPSGMQKVSAPKGTHSPQWANEMLSHAVDLLTCTSALLGSLALKVSAAEQRRLQDTPSSTHFLWMRAFDSGEGTPRDPASTFRGWIHAANKMCADSGIAARLFRSGRHGTKTYILDRSFLARIAGDQETNPDPVDDGGVRWTPVCVVLAMASALTPCLERLLSATAGVSRQHEAVNDSRRRLAELLVCDPVNIPALLWACHCLRTDHRDLVPAGAAGLVKELARDRRDRFLNVSDGAPAGPDDPSVDETTQYTALFASRVAAALSLHEATQNPAKLNREYGYILEILPAIHARQDPDRPSRSPDPAWDRIPDDVRCCSMGDKRIDCHPDGPIYFATFLSQVFEREFELYEGESLADGWRRWWRDYGGGMPSGQLRPLPGTGKPEDGGRDLEDIAGKEDHFIGD